VCVSFFLCVFSFLWRFFDRGQIKSPKFCVVYVHLCGGTCNAEGCVVRSVFKIGECEGGLKDILRNMH